MAAVTVVDRFPVKPPSAGGAALPLTLFDVPWLFTGPVERLFFYPLPFLTSQFLAGVLPSLLSALSDTLRHFYPLAGRLRAAAAGYEFSYAEGDSVPFTVAECSDDFDALSGNGPRDLQRLYALVPELPKGDGQPLLAVQATVFPGKGLGIGVAIHHVACDDASYMHFINSWAASCRAAPTPPPPFFDRSVIADPDGLAARTMAEMAAQRPPPAANGHAKPKLVIASFALTGDCISKLKETVISAAGGAPVHCSSFSVACAFAWACLVKEDGGDDKAHLLFSVQCRSRLKPPIPAEYFGNCLRPCFVEVDAGELVGRDGVPRAAMAIGSAVKGLEDGGVLSGADEWFTKIVSLVPKRPMSIGGSPRYGVYEADFGWGRPAKVELVSIDKTPGTVSMAEGRDGRGGIEIGVVLPEPAMARFSRRFSDALDALCR